MSHSYSEHVFPDLFSEGLEQSVSEADVQNPELSNINIYTVCLFFGFQADEETSSSINFPEAEVKI